jgi:hypothetical protein
LHGALREAFFLAGVIVWERWFAAFFSGFGEAVPADLRVRGLPEGAVTKFCKKDCSS